MADLTTLANAAAWLGVDVSDPFLARLVPTASAYVLTYVGRDASPWADDEVPLPVEQACIELVTAMYRDRSKDARVSSISLGDGSISFRNPNSAIDSSTGILPDTAKALLAPYRRLLFASSF